MYCVTFGLYCPAIHHFLSDVGSGRHEPFAAFRPMRLDKPTLTLCPSNVVAVAYLVASLTPHLSTSRGLLPGPQTE